jgi:hypothetical protein
MIHSLFLSNFPQRAGERGDGFSIAQKRRGVKADKFKYSPDGEFEIKFLSPHSIGLAQSFDSSSRLTFVIFVAFRQASVLSL